MTCLVCNDTRMRSYGNLGVVGIFGDCDACAVTASDWHPEHVKATIRARGVTLSELSDRCGCEPSTIAKAIRKPISLRLEQAIARFLGVPAATIWPSRYQGPGNTRHTSTRIRGAA